MVRLVRLKLQIVRFRFVPLRLLAGTVWAETIGRVERQHDHIHQEPHEGGDQDDLARVEANLGTEHGGTVERAIV